MTLLIALIISAATAHASDPAAPAQGLDEVTAALQQDLSVRPRCHDYAEYARVPRCSYRELCGFFQANTGGAGKYLYSKASGQALPNFRLFEAEGAVQSCLMMKANGPPGPEQAKRFQEALIANLEKQKAFLDSVGRHHEETAATALERAAVQLSLDDARKGPAPMSSGRSHEEVEADLAELEKRAGSKLSAESRGLYLDWLYASSNPNPAPEWKGVNSDPFLDTDRLVDEKAAGSASALADNRAEYQAQATRAYGLFQHAKDGIKAMLLARRTKENAAAIDNMISRISTITMSPVKVEEGFDPEYPCPAPNAFYDPMTHSFKVCPQLLEMPDVALKTIITHELAHSIDPCDLSGPLLSVTGDAQGAPPSPVAPTVGSGEFAPSLPDQGHAVYAEDVVGNASQVLAPEYKNISTRIVEPAIGLDHNPFSKLVSCLASSSSVGARMPDQRSLKRQLDSAIEKVRQTGATPETSPQLARLLDAKRNLPALIHSHGACAFLAGKDGKTQAQEAFADWVAGEVVGGDLARAPESVRSEGAFESVSFFLGMSCPGPKSRTDAAVSKFLSQNGCASQGATVATLSSIQDAQAINGDEHPWDTTRVDRLFLANPAYRHALGCGRSEAKHCE